MSSENYMKVIKAIMRIKSYEAEINKELKTISENLSLDEFINSNFDPDKVEEAITNGEKFFKENGVTYERVGPNISKIKCGDFFVDFNGCGHWSKRMNKIFNFLDKKKIMS